jgi:uncharacterized protein (TIGR00106 family)
MMLVMFSIAPFGKGDSLSKYVAESVEVIEKSGIAHQTTPMGTILEGDWEEIFDLINRCRKKMRKRADRISIKIWVDDRKGTKNALKKKIASLEKKLGHEIQK